MQLTKHWAAPLDDYVIDLAWSPDGTQLAAASSAGPVSLFASSDGAKRHELPGHAGGTNCLAWQLVAGAMANAAILATGGQDGTVKIWDATNGQHLSTAKLGSAWVEQLSWRPARQPEARGQRTEDGRRATEDGGRTDLDPPSSGLQPLSSVLRLPSSVSPSAATLAAVAGRDCFFLHPDGTVRHRFKPAPKTITALAWQPAGGCVAIAYFGGVCLWDADDFAAQKEFPYANGIHALVWSPDSKWLVSGNQDPSVHLWIPAEDIELHMSGYEGKVKHLSFDHTSRWLATGGGQDACIWDCSGKGPEGREPAMLPHGGPVCALAFQRSHGLLATASQDGAVMLWSPERKQPLRATVKMPSPATKLAWSPHDRQLAIGCENGVVYVLNCES